MASRPRSPDLMPSPGGPGRLPAQGSHRSGRARIRASGSSAQGLATRVVICATRRTRCSPRRAMLSSPVPGIRAADDKASGVGPGDGSMCGRPSSLRRVAVEGRSPGFVGTTRGRCDTPSPLPPRFVPFAWRYHRLRPLLRSRRSRRSAGRPGLLAVRPTRDAAVMSGGDAGDSHVPGEPTCPFAHGLGPRRDCWCQTDFGAAARPPLSLRRGLPH